MIIQYPNQKFVEVIVVKICLLMMNLFLAGSLASAGDIDQSSPAKKATFVDVKEIDPSIIVEARYAGSLNFTGKPVPGYKAPKCLLTPEAAKALGKAQELLKPMGLSLKAYDCYRPQEAVDSFMVWSNGKDNPRLKRFYYQREQIDKLFERGYIAEKSGHSRGSTIDLSIVAPSQNKPLQSLPLSPCFKVPGLFDSDGSLNMGTTFDCFDERSYTADDKVSEQARANRLLLKTVMEQSGFKNYEKEWWHYTLADEPFKDRYFTEPVR